MPFGRHARAAQMSLCRPHARSPGLQSLDLPLESPDLPLDAEARELASAAQSGPCLVTNFSSWSRLRSPLLIASAVAEEWAWHSPVRPVLPEEDEVVALARALALALAVLVSGEVFIVGSSARTESIGGLMAAIAIIDARPNVAMGTAARRRAMVIGSSV